MRIYAKLSDDMDEKLSEYAKSFGMSKSSFVAYSVGKHINELEHLNQTFDQISDVLAKQVKDITNGKEFKDGELQD